MPRDGAPEGPGATILLRLDQDVPADVRSADERQTGAILRDVEPEDLLKYGLIPEFVGRLPILATLEDLDEQALIEGVLAETHGRVSGPAGAAVKLGLPASTLESKIRALKINKHQFKLAANP